MRRYSSAPSLLRILLFLVKNFFQRFRYMVDNLYHLGGGSRFGVVPRKPICLRRNDSGLFNPSQVQRDSRLIGRSVWNTRWLLVIPAATLHNDRNEGLNSFIDGRLVGGQRDGNGVQDIKIFFETYAYSGN